MEKLFSENENEGLLLLSEVSEEDVMTAANKLQNDQVPKQLFSILIVIEQGLYSQTFTSLYLSSNRIGDQAAEHLAAALQTNTVPLSLPSSLTSLSSIGGLANHYIKFIWRWAGRRFTSTYHRCSTK